MVVTVGGDCNWSVVIVGGNVVIGGGNVVGGA